MLIPLFGKPDFDRGCGYLAGTETRITVTWQLEIYPQGYPQVSYLANPQLGFALCQNGIGSIKSRQGEAMYRHEVPTSRAVLNLENKHADAERLSSPRG
jgi:hypothetical protein